MVNTVWNPARYAKAVLEIYLLLIISGMVSLITVLGAVYVLERIGGLLRKNQAGCLLGTRKSHTVRNVALRQSIKSNLVCTM
jgi:hypothetical protein